MVVGVGLLGVGTLADLALVQLVGIVAGALSSLLLATPLLVDLKMRDRRFQEQAARVVARRRRPRHAASRGARRARRRRTTRSRPPTTPSSRGSCGGSGRPRRPRAPRPARGKPAAPRPAPGPTGKASGPPASGTGEPSGRRSRPGAGPGPDPRRPGLPDARRAVPGHHAGAGRPRGVRGGDHELAIAGRRGRRRGRHRGARLPARRGGRRWSRAPAWCRCARRASCRGWRRRAPTTWSTAPPRWSAGGTVAPGRGVFVVDDVLATGGTAGGDVRAAGRRGRRAWSGSAWCWSCAALGGRDAAGPDPGARAAAPEVVRPDYPRARASYPGQAGCMTERAAGSGAAGARARDGSGEARTPSRRPAGFAPASPAG